jgi:transposase-like protein
MKDAEDGPGNLSEAIRYFSNPDVANAFVARLRWPEGPVCPQCGGKEHSYLSTRRLWKCRTCSRQFSVKVGTIFEGSPIGLDKWLAAIWLIANSQDEVSSYEIQQTIGVTQKTAWSMMRRIRRAMQAGTFDSLCVGAGIEGRFEGGGPVEVRHLGD